MIETEYTGDAESFRKVVEKCLVPVLITSGLKMETTKQVLETVKDVIDSGGAGIFFGRNIFSTGIPKRLHEPSALMSVEEDFEGC